MRRLFLTISVGATLVLTGCATDAASDTPAGPSTASPERAEPSAVDPCADRFHDYIGGLLFYYYQFGVLPESLAEVNAPGLGLPPPVCPTSGVPYAYSVDGIRLPERNKRVVLYEGVQAHGSYRWGVSVDDPDGSGQLQMKVLPLPERVFLLR